jgi:hypothetical protein
VESNGSPFERRQAGLPEDRYSKGRPAFSFQSGRPMSLMSRSFGRRSSVLEHLDTVRRRERLWIRSKTSSW